MRDPSVASAALLAALLLAPPASSEASSFAVDFDAPGQASGSAHADGLQWVVLAFQGPDAPRFRFTSEGGGTATNETVLRLRARDSGHLFDYEQPTRVTSIPSPLPASTDLALDFPADGWSSLSLQAERIRLEAGDADWTLGRAQPRGAVDDAWAQAGAADALGRSPADPGAILAKVAKPAAPASIRLAAEGIRSISWHNATVACFSPDGCPDGARTFGLTAADGGKTLALEAVSYMDVEVPGGTLDGQGSAVLAAAGGVGFDLLVDGTLRLPGAVVSGSCGGAPCPDPAGRTFRADGQLTLQGLSPHPDDPQRLRAALAGDVEEASFDETPVAAFLAGAAAPGAAALALALLLKLAKPLVGLFARRPASWLQHPRAQELNELVRTRPGLSFQNLRRATGWASGTTDYHLKRLLAAGAIVAEPYRNTVRYFENHGRYRHSWPDVVQLSDPDLRRLHALILEQPGQTQANLLRQARAWGWSRGRVQRRLRELACDDGLVSTQRVGRSTTYTGRPPRGPAPAPAPRQAA